MQRDLDALVKTRFDLAVIGGGVIGAAIARDAARRGMVVALVERDDFACGASEAMSHLIHGGIRYLAQGQLTQVVQSMAERAIWRRTAPDFVSPQPFLVPLIDKGMMAKLALSLGTRLFEMLGRNGLGRRLSRAETVAAEPALDSVGLEGAYRYSDSRVDQPERLVLALLEDAARHGAVIANHAEAVGLERRGAGIRLSVHDAATASRLQLDAGAIANVTGPWAEQLASRLVPGQRSVALTASKGIHIVTRQLTKTHAVTLPGRHEYAIIVPWGGYSLIGTTDDAYEGDLAKLSATPAEVAALTEKVTRLLPSAREVLKEPIATFAGARALPGAAKGDTYSVARDFAIVAHAEDGVPGFFTIYGGKWTTARLIAERTVDRLVTTLSRSAKPCDTARAIIPPLPSVIGEAGLDRASADEMASTEADLLRRMTRLHTLRDPQARERARQHVARGSVGRP
jgi:glycerol-3-phosphate dehydrogenase